MKKIHILQLFAGEVPAEAAATEEVSTSQSVAAEAPQSEVKSQAEQEQDPVRSAEADTEEEARQAQLRSQRYLATRDAFVRHQYAIWKQQAEQAKEEYPDLDMNQEAKNPQFRRYLHAGLDVASAYLLVHRQQVLEQNARQVESRIAQRMMAASTRPSENGSSGRASAVTRADIASMTRKEREAIRRRAARGERVRF